MRQPFSGTAERIFVKLYQTIPGKMEFETSCRRLAKVVPPPCACRMLMICVIYAMTLAQSPEGATHGGCVIKSRVREWI